MLRANVLRQDFPVCPVSGMSRAHRVQGAKENTEGSEDCADGRFL